MANTIAQAYVQIMPSMEGVQNNLNKELGDAGKSAGQSFNGGFGEVFSGTALGNLATSALSSVAGAVTGAVDTVASKVGELSQAAVQGYADYEQLIGGVETLFGNEYSSVQEYADGVGASLEMAEGTWEQYQNRQATVLANADNAYKTAGLSANEYMETVNGFAAALNNSLGEYAWQSANYADEAVTDMADNSNKMGTSMESIQNAYAGFAKGNFTMLDNLKLGYGGTQAEMDRLLRKAEELEGYEEGALSRDKFSDVIEAIHIIQEDLGITGTTAKEASTTISGSLATLQSAWDNLVVGFANDNADISQLIGNVVESAETAFNNLLPVAEKALEGVAEFITKIAPIIADKLPGIVDQILPAMTTAFEAIISAITQVLPTLMETVLGEITKISEPIMNAFLQMLPQFFNIGIMLFQNIIDGLIQIIPEVAAVAPDLVQTIGTALIENAPIIWQSVFELMNVMTQTFYELAPQLYDVAAVLIPQFVEMLLSTGIPLIISAAETLIQSMIEGLVAAWPQIIAAGVDLIAQLAVGITLGIPDALDALLQLKKDMDNTFKDLVFKGLTWGGDLILNFVKGILDKSPSVKSAVNKVASLVKDNLGFSEPKEGPLSDFHTYAPDMMELFAKGIKDNENLITAQLQSSFDIKGQLAKQSTDAVAPLQDMSYTVDAQTAVVDTSNDDGLSIQFAQAVELLGRLVDKDPVELNADAAGIFNLVRKQNTQYIRANGRGAFA